MLLMKKGLSTVIESTDASRKGLSTPST